MASTRSGRLTHTFIKSIAKPGRYGDGRGSYGLSVLVRKTANGRWSKTFSQRLRINGQITNLGLGAYPLITLAMAREKCVENAQRVSRGEDIRTAPPLIPTVDIAFDTVIRLRAPSWKGQNTRYSWNRSKWYCNSIGSTPVSDLKTTDVLAVLAPHWTTLPKTARGIRTHLSAAMQWAIDAGHRETDPANSRIVKNLGSQPRSKRVPSLPHEDLGHALAVIRDSKAWWTTKSCLIFLALTCVRSGEARQATWTEIDFDRAIWTIPAARMKAGLEHRVPLSNQAVELLLHAGEQSSSPDGLIFPPQHGASCIHANLLPKLMHRLEVPAVPHGFRSSFRNWAAHPSILHHAAEMVLAHTPSDDTVAAYLTTDFFELRRPIMQRWADYLTTTMGHVISPTQP